MDKLITIFWLAGESSGDLHCELIMKALTKDGKRYHHLGIGGPKMQAQGLKPLFPFDRFAVMGFVEVLAHLVFFLKVEQRIKRLFEEAKPDLVILADYPGLNLRIAHLADEYRIPVLYYIVPQFWAWKHDRVFKIKASVRHAACILPFEEELLTIHNIACSYVGHPIAEEIEHKMDRDTFARFFHLNANKKWLGFFPGSRNSEAKKMLPTFLKAAKQWDQKEYEILVSKSHGVNHQLFMDLVSGTGMPNLNIIDGYNYDMMQHCDALVCTSGTVTLEASYIGTPSVICYRANPLSYLIGKHLVRVSRIGLPNIILDNDVLPELVQRDMNIENINAKLREILPGSPRREVILLELRKLRAMLSDKKPSVELPQIIEQILITYG
ncbi:MAG: lipid-A-disaccharide synthase [Candidatus Cloacimonetes bacterium]|nr:lipid-A-disaccharide synthase [Candidatus Cloacimonadota bacterium]MCB5286465.1 lipid-A-disaccharide synthase [Candidatus Cloacimonadota bacterium]MCK9184982.1 lipid-A-disaccharide synthase [Candidatus Cloacimonadota bacterium]MCK9583493.1 lipid-A-disaccharide synthase [Candidatus Cloacimonadota bacterium]MDY0228787.1 lipid-A-disaccharide synthase [Candidatus Cloacimonadaceae bacterium]